MSIKSLGKQSLIYGFGHILARLVTFLLLPMYTHVFTPSQYGTISLAYAFIGFAMVLYRYGMDTALMKFSVQEDGKSRQNHITAIIISQFVTGIILSFMLHVFRDPLSWVVLGSANQEWISYIAIILFFDSIWNLPMLLLRSEERPVIYMSFSLLNVIMTMGLNIYFVIHLGKGVDGVFEANMIASGTIFILTLPILYNRIHIQSFNKGIIKKVLLFAIPFLPAGLFTMVMELSDRYLLEWLAGTSAVGLYSAGKKLGMLGLVIIMGFNMGWTPYFLKRVKEKDARSDFSKIATIFLGILGYLLLVVILWIPSIMRFSIAGKSLIGSEFWTCEPIVSAILIGYFFFGIYVLQLPGIYKEERTKWIPVFRLIGALIMIVSGYVFIPIYSEIGAAYSVILAFLGMSISIFIINNKTYKVPYNWLGIVFPLIFVVISTQFEFNTIERFGMIIVYPIVWFSFILNKDEKIGIKSLVQ